MKPPNSSSSNVTSPPTGSQTGDPTSVRRVALEALVECESSRKFIDDALAPRLARFRERDRHLLQEVTYGAIRHRNTLDHLVDAHLKFPTARQKPAVASALRIGAYQLVYLDRVPAHAAVNQTLEGLKALGGVGAGEVGFVNAVLHKLSDEIRLKTEEPPVDPDDPSVLPVRRGYCCFTRPVLPTRSLDTLGHLSLRHSHPVWLVKAWTERFGEDETIDLLIRNNVTPAVTARVTRLAPSRDAAIEALRTEGWEAAPGPLESSIVLRKLGSLHQSETFRRGWFQVQDLTAIRIGEALKPPPGARVLDLCAAPGSKSVQLLDAVGPEGHVVAADRSEERVAMVGETLSRFGTAFSVRLVPDETERVELGETFSHILVDAPCSNTGVLARRPEVRWRIQRKDVEALASLQLRLLELALRHLAPGGRLLYATCSIEPDENENVVAQLFRSHRDLVELETRLFLPHRTEGDGGFYSLILKPR